MTWSLPRRKFFGLADIRHAGHRARTDGAINGSLRNGKPAHAISPVAPEAVARIDPIFGIGDEINGLDAAARSEARQRLSRSLVDSVHEWTLAGRDRISKHNPVTTGIN